MQGDELSTIVAETSFRLFKSLASDPAFKTRLEAKTKAKRERTMSWLQSQEPKLQGGELLFASLMHDMNMMSLMLTCHMRTNNRVLEIALAGLSEKSQREAVQQLRALTPEDVLKDIA